MSVAFLAIVVLTCADIALFSHLLELRKLALGGLFALFAGWMGYSAGKSKSGSGE